MRNVDKLIIIGQSGLDDVSKIWDILHANCNPWTMQEIRQNTGKLFVLMMGDKMVGVLYADLNRKSKVVDWVEIHPLYPEKILKDIFIKGLLGTLWPDIEEKALQKVLQKANNSNFCHACT